MILTRNCFLSLAFLFFCFLLTSCATIFNSRKSPTFIDTGIDTALIIVDKRDTICCTNNTVKFRRSTRNLHVELLKDSIKKSVVLKSKPGALFLIGNLFTYGVGYPIDVLSQKGFRYPYYVKYNLRDSSDKVTIPYLRRRAEINHKFRINTLFPYFNTIRTRTINDEITHCGFMGMGIEADYFFNRTSYISGSGSGLLTFIVPFPAPFHWTGERQDANASYINSRFNMVFSRFEFGAGISYQQLTWNFYYSDTTSRSNDYSFIRKSKGIGLSITGQFFPANYFYIGGIYQPMLYNLSRSRWDYLYTWSVELGVKIPFNKL